ncbi:MAG: hypothetical protein II919_01930 [Lachnospiraceae bacterium]|nr:hypothetical protein [Lachnospiraceae bacterium]
MTRKWRYEVYMKKFVQDSIRMNDDDYNPSEITCFNKPMAMLFNSIDDNYFDLYLFTAVFYENFMFDGYFSWDDYLGNLNENFYKYSKDVLEPRFKVKINKVIYNDKEEFLTKVINMLENNIRVLIPGSLKELPYYEDYQTNDHVHYFLIRGFDTEKNLFFIIDNMQIDGGSEGRYKYFAVTFDMMYSLAKSSLNIFDYEEAPYFWVVKVPEKDEKYSIYQALYDHKDELKRSLDDKNMIRFPEFDIINKKTLKEVHLSAVTFSKLYARVLNSKRVYYDILIELLGKSGISENEINIIQEKKDKLYKNWESLRMLILLYTSKKTKDLQELMPNYEKCVKQDNDFRSMIINYIDGIKIHNSDDLAAEQYKFFKFNYHKVKLNIEEEVVYFEHHSNLIYDTWKNQDNAPQLLFNVNPEDEIEFSFDLYIDNVVDFPFFSGLIIKNKGGEIYLFGDDAKCSMALYCPQYEKNFVLGIEDFFSDDMSIKIMKKNSDVGFYYKEANKNEWNHLCNAEITDMKQIGIISKTWNAIKHKSIFKNIRLLLNGEKVELF